MSKKVRHAGNLELIGGRLCLDFINTVSVRAGPGYREYLGSYADLVTWAQHAGLLSDAEARRLLRRAKRQPAEAQAALAQAVAVRETLYRIFAALARGLAPRPRDLALFNQYLGAALRRLEVEPAAAGFAWRWQPGEDLDRIVWPVLRSAGELLTSAELDRVRQCARREACDWLFLDTSKNRSRRWCSMAACGSLTKTHRYYARQRARRSAHS